MAASISVAISLQSLSAASRFSGSTVVSEIPSSKANTKLSLTFCRVFSEVDWLSATCWNFRCLSWAMKSSNCLLRSADSEGYVYFSTLTLYSTGASSVFCLFCESEFATSCSSALVLTVFKCLYTSFFGSSALQSLQRRSECWRIHTGWKRPLHCSHSSTSWASSGDHITPQMHIGVSSGSSKPPFRRCLKKKIAFLSLLSSKKGSSWTFFLKSPTLSTFTSRCTFWMNSFDCSSVMMSSNGVW